MLAAALLLEQGIWLAGPYTIVILDSDAVHRTCVEQGLTPRPGYQMAGCYVPAEHMIYTVNDASVLAHELKHALEPAWQRHGEEDPDGVR